MPIPSFSYTVTSGIVAAIVGGKLRITFPRTILDTPGVRVPSQYGIVPPAGFPALSVSSVAVVSSQSIDLTLSGVLRSGLYSLTISADSVRYEDDGLGNPEEVVTFQGVQTQYSAPSKVLRGAAGFLGSGLSFPLRVGSDGQFVKVAGEDNVDECLVQLLQTEQGERPFAVRDGVLFGSRLRRILFEHGETARDLAYQTVNEAVTVWEPRIRILDLQARKVTQNGMSAILLGIKYLIVSTNNVRNLVFPYSLG